MYKQQPIQIFDILGVRYYGDPKSLTEAPNSRLAEKLAEAEPLKSAKIKLWERTQALPRSWIVHRTREVGSTEEAVRLLRDPAFDPRAVGLVTRSAASTLDSFATEVPAILVEHGAIENVRIEKLTDRDVEIIAESERAGLLVLSDLWYPGWTATVNGAPAEILRVDAIFRGVRIQQGISRVLMRYDPESHRYGAFASGLGLVALFGLLMWPTRSTKAPALRLHVAPRFR